MILSPRARLMVAAALFLGWIGYLFFLMINSRDPVILSRPQFQVANLHVVAVLTGGDFPDGTITIKEVLEAPEVADEKLQGQKVSVKDLEEKVEENKQDRAITGWRGPGEYLLPLLKLKDGLRLAPIPLSPGYRPFQAAERLRIYPATPQAMRQREQIR
jgi:hypothetical protein